MPIPERFSQLDFRPSELSDEILVAPYEFEGCEAQLLYYPEGTLIPAHRHSTNTLHVVLQGCLRAETAATDGPIEYAAGADYNCGGWEYRALAVRDTVVLLLQTPGTTFVISNVE